MSRRQKPSNLESGSDSFLDIIANIVGILIILIVIAGVRVSQMPAKPESETAATVPLPVPEIVEEESVPEIPVLLGGTDDLPSGDFLPPPAPVVIAEKPREQEPPRPPQPSPQLLADITELKQEIDRLTQKSNKITPQIAEVVLSRERIVSAAQEADQQTERERSAQNQLKAQVVTRQQEIADDMMHLAILADEIKTRETEQPEVKKLIHKLTPVSKVVEGDEYHFRLENNRVSFVPLKQLINELKTQLDHRRSVLSRTRTHQGVVGPIEGYRLRYLVERTPLSMMDELKYGSGMFRVAVSAWQLQVTPEVKDETAEEALRVGSRFVEVLKTAPPETTLTLWVYPDSFSLFRELQTVLHANGFNVAARPLPHGVPIAGSPEGSRSAGQ